MKKIIALFLCLLLVSSMLILSSCDDTSDDPTPTEQKDDSEKKDDTPKGLEKLNGYPRFLYELSNDHHTAHHDVRTGSVTEYQPNRNYKGGRKRVLRKDDQRYGFLCKYGDLVRR